VGKTVRRFRLEEQSPHAAGQDRCAVDELLAGSHDRRTDVLAAACAQLRLQRVAAGRGAVDQQVREARRRARRGRLAQGDLLRLRDAVQHAHVSINVHPRLVERRCDVACRLVKVGQPRLRSRSAAALLRWCGRVQTTRRGPEVLGLPTTLTNVFLNVSRIDQLKVMLERREVLDLFAVGHHSAADDHILERQGEIVHLEQETQLI
jgi:hypothetical protein